MSRKDTIMIAVLLNAGLLIALFATTLKSQNQEGYPKIASIEESLTTSSSEDKKQDIIAANPSPIESIAVNSSSSSLDEVEQVIRKYATPNTAANAVEITPNFAADLQAIGEANPQVASASVIAQSESAIASDLTTSYKQIKVQKGDVLEKIAKNHRTTVDEIMKANKLSSSRLKIGQTLKIPEGVGKKKITPVSSSEKAQDNSGVKYYTIKNGDNPWTIAVKNHMKVEELLKLNNLNEEKARHLKPGDQIRIN